ncbi:RNA-binding protein YlmH [Breznakia blatticola]|uniref:RNA-binding protein YlmH n=1 Tax=Breznakia blatticola TaxID=1754012 RepID=A0A4R7ZJI4_9FIRM|nr:YlmH/Sll1252 family protein [Breznakia blatticola]MDH6367090.1 RNA-binding protein YlmH [Breznakia sp. PH1-1]MDH6404323.1 RNA-binding protein YlmH [Breznakia sp. PF1-11]MDH6411977.1 RNA-binding protein YlmH [Breznakia sp. PFB1-11]MDH6414311.1 RNA-binding protein YlmH [Breznakia sp. PFB1-14]MDH6416591.1 RNA-binding protein YlmH [Breznakia sp. PFB1-4]MDH6419009.1 RNA-binding protein YlmH [Breznakia sp. PFB1-12]MDH6474392.1 RNA-binding protein YlmH [Breznakia sp. PFB2-30]MDH6476380.1 RNA-bi
MNKQKQIHFKGNEDFLARIDDYLDQLSIYHKVFTPFLSPAEQEILQRYVGKKVYTTFDGGYPDAEYKRCLLSYEDKQIPLPIVCLHAIYDTKYYNLSHRDALGAMMNLGIERQTFGDLIVEHGDIYIFVSKDIAGYIKRELEKIGRCPIQLEESEAPIQKEIHLEYKTHMVSSLRLDALVASITHLARQKAQALVHDGRVKVDHLVVEDLAHICDNKSILISIRGYGRFMVNDTGRKTKNNRFVLEIGKYE